MDEDEYVDEDDNPYDRAYRAERTVWEIVATFNKTHPDCNPRFDITEMPNCCSGLVLSGNTTPENKEAKTEDLVQLMQEILKALGEGYSWLMSTLLMGGQGEWAKVLVASGFEESVQISRSNDYNGPQPLRVFIKALRPMTADEVEKSLRRYKKQSAKAKKGGYEW